MDIFASYPNGGKTLISNVPTANVDLKSGEVLRVSYTAPNGKTHVIDISASHMVLVASHQGTDAAIVCRPESVIAVN